MRRISIQARNFGAPKALFMLGANKEDGRATFGLFSWFSYYWDGELHVMCAISGESKTASRILATGEFSANLVTEENLKLADQFGNSKGFEVDKSTFVEAVRGAVLDVPIIPSSPWVFELKVNKSMKLDFGALFLCDIANVLADERIADEGLDAALRNEIVKPVVVVPNAYFSVGKKLGDWGEFARQA